MLGIFDWGDAGIDFFFVLSGFIIYWANSDRFDDRFYAGTYLCKRFCRIYPIYWVVTVPLILAYFLLPIERQGFETDPSAIAGSLALVPVTEYPILPVAWTLCYEVYFYLIFAGLLVDRRAGFAIIVAWQLSVLANSAFGLSGPAWFEFCSNPLNLHFGLGMVAACLLKRRIIHRPAPLLLVSVAALVAIGLHAVFADVARDPLWHLGFACAATVVVGSLVSLEARGGVRIPGLLMLLGSASYSIYLLHYPVQLVSIKAFKFAEQWVALPSGLVFLCLVGISMTASLMLHVVVERPLTGALRAFCRRQQQLPA